MNRTRKDTIIKEIIYWKKSKLLPEHYCDFLLTLYSEGNDLPKNLHNKTRFFPIMSTFLVSSVFFFPVLILYFTDFPFLLQMTVGFFSVLIILGTGKYIKKSSKTLSHVFLLLAAILILIVMMEGISNLFPNNKAIIVSTIIFTCIVWVIIGLRWKLRYFTIAGIIGFCISLIFLISNFML